jgi:GNAT superfamily N-acetyltransferase
VFTEDSAKKNRAPYEILERHRYGNQLMWEGKPWVSKKIIDPETGKAKRTPYEPAYRVRGEVGEMILPESAIKGRVELAKGGLAHMAEGGQGWTPHPESELLQPIGSSKMVGEEKLVSDDGDFKSGLSMFPSRKKSYRYIYHDEDKTPIGAMQIATQGPRSKKAVIQNLYVAESNRRQGVASKLLDRARQDFDVKHSDDLTTAGRAFAKAKKAHGGRVTHAHHLDIEEHPL